MEMEKEKETIKELLKKMKVVGAVAAGSNENAHSCGSKDFTPAERQTC
jgi:hypothetical protein